MCVVRIMCGVNGAERGSGRGPWTVQVSFKADLDCETRNEVSVLGYG